MKTTKTRKALEAYLGEQTGFESQVWIVPTEYDKGSFGTNDEVKLGARLLIGSAEDTDNEDKVDELFEKMPGLLAVADIPNVETIQVLSCAGHRLYGMQQGEPPIMGTEFTLKVTTEED